MSLTAKRPLFLIFLRKLDRDSGGVSIPPPSQHPSTLLMPQNGRDSGLATPFFVKHPALHQSMRHVAASYLDHLNGPPQLSISTDLSRRLIANRHPAIVRVQNGTWCFRLATRAHNKFLVLREMWTIDGVRSTCIDIPRLVAQKVKQPGRDARQRKSSQGKKAITTMHGERPREGSNG